MAKRYERLVGALHAVRQACPTVPVLSIIWMHPKYPVHRVQQALIEAGSTGRWSDDTERPSGLAGCVKRMAARKSPVLRFAVCAANAARLSVKLSRLRQRQRQRIELLRGRSFDIVAKTWCFGLQRPAGEDDFYYGDLQQRLTRRGVRTLLLCGDSSGSDWHRFSDAHLSTSELARMPELCLVSPRVPLRMLWRQWQSSRMLKRIASNTADGMIENVARAASLDVLSLAVTQSGFFFWIGQEVARTWRPRALVTLYEGHGWEKCVWWGAKTEYPACRTVGYQHTVLFPQAVALTKPFVDIRERSVPDIVLALGEPTREAMKDGHEVAGSRVIPFGTFRYDGRQASGAAPPDRRQVLVIPEGEPSEMRTLFGFAHQCARLLPSHTVVVRSHPKWPIGRALGELDLDVADLPNVVASERTIDEDFARSSIILYRGSSAVLYGLLSGLFPIYLRVEGRVEADPLQGLRSWRRICATPEQFVEIVTEYAAMSATTRDAEWRRAAAFVSDYASAVDERRIGAFLAEIGS